MRDRLHQVCGKTVTIDAHYVICTRDEHPGDPLHIMVTDGKVLSAWVMEFPPFPADKRCGACGHVCSDHLSEGAFLFSCTATGCDCPDFCTLGPMATWGP